MNRITREEFEREFGSLCKTMGVQMTGVRVDQELQWYDIFKYEPQSVVRSAFKMAASRTQKMFPSLSEVKEVLKIARNNEAEKMKDRITDSCTLCEGRGTVIGTDNLAYRCVCELGERFAKNFRTIPRNKVQPLDPELHGRLLPTGVALRCMEVIRESLRLRRTGAETWKECRSVMEEMGHLPRRVPGDMSGDSERSLAIVQGIFQGSTAVSHTKRDNPTPSA